MKSKSNHTRPRRANARAPRPPRRTHQPVGPTQRINAIIVDGPRPWEQTLQVELDTKLWRKLEKDAAKLYGCSPDRLLTSLARCHLGADNLPRDPNEHGRAFERALLQHINGAPVDLSEIRPIALADNRDANDYLREGLARVLSEYHLEAGISFTAPLVVRRHQEPHVRELAVVLEIEPTLLLEHVLTLWLADMHHPKHGRLEDMAGKTLSYAPKIRKRILAGIARWRAARAKGERGPV